MDIQVPGDEVGLVSAAPRQLLPSAPRSTILLIRFGQVERTDIALNILAQALPLLPHLVEDAAQPWNTVLAFAGYALRQDDRVDQAEFPDATGEGLKFIL